MPSSPEAPRQDLFIAARQPLLEGRFAAAAELLQQHLQAQPADARAWGLLARCRRLLQQLPEGLAAAQRALELQPEFPAIWLERGLLERDTGAGATAIAWLRRCLAAQPGHTECRWELARALARPDPAEALQILLPLRAARPHEPEPALLEAWLRLNSGDDAGAQVLYDRLLEGGMVSVETLEGAYWARVHRDVDLAGRVALARRLVEQAPTAERWMNLSQDLNSQGDYAASRQLVEQVMVQWPDFLPARWARFQLPPWVAPPSMAEAERFRADWAAGLAAFEAVDFDPDPVRAQVWGCVGQCTAFFRHYLGDEVEQQRRYGRLLHRMMTALDADAVGAPRPLRRRRRRIGFCSAHFFEHTVSRLFVPLIEALDREQFELQVFSLRDRGDAWSQRLRACASVHGGEADWQLWAKRIRAAELDVLVYPEVGMNPTIQGLAALRLAPVQAVLWGHPVTTGLPNMDLYLSADALEPEDAQSHYSEQLVRLPGLGHGLRRQDLPTAIAPPAELIGGADIELLCAQTVFKLQPEQDAVFARILAALPQARLHMLADDRPPVQQFLRQRMAPALRAAGADPERQLVIHGFIKHPYYLGLAQGCRLNLDSIGWSGGMSALDLLAQGLPTVCLPGTSMRSQQTANLLRRLQLPQLIARDPDHYVELAVELAQDAGRCAELRRQLLASSECLFADPVTVDAWQRLLAEVERGADGELRVPSWPPATVVTTPGDADHG